MRRAPLLAALLCLLAGPTAWAQEGADGGATSGDDDLVADDVRSTPRAGVEEILVIGEVLEASTQAESEAITTFDQAELDALGIADVDTLALNTPSLHVGQVGQQAVITLRGVGLENLTSVGEAGVGFQIDGVHLGRPSGANAAFFDLENVNVQRGPIGTRGGRQTNGGRIELWSAKPRDELDATANLKLGNYDAKEIQSVLNIPVLGETLMTRLSVLYSEHDGYMDLKLFENDDDNPGDAEDFAGRLQLRSLLMDQRLEMRVIGAHSTQKGNGPALKLIGSPPSTIAGSIGSFDAPGNPVSTSEFPFVIENCPQPGRREAPFYTDQRVCTSKDPRESYAELGSTRDNEQNGITGIVTLDLPVLQDTFLSDLRVGFIGSHQQNIEDGATDFDGTNIPEQIFDQRRNTHQTSFEAYLERPEDIGFWDFRAGLYYYEEKIDSTLCLDTGGLRPFTDLQFEGDIDTRSMAAYGEVGIEPIEGFRLHGGVRWTEDQKDAVQLLTNYTNVVANSIGAVPPGGCSRFFYDRYNLPNGALIQDVRVAIDSDSWQGITPAAGFEFDLTDTSSVGFSYSRGFKAGGFPLGVDPQATGGLNEPYDAEFVTEYELSSKNQLFDGRLTLNVTAFWTEYDPFQICQFAGATFFCEDDGSATVRGVEIEMNAEPIDGLRLNGFFNYLDTRINDFLIVDPTDRECLTAQCTVQSPPQNPRPLVPQDVSGNRLPKAPIWAGSLGLQYEIDGGRYGFFTPRVQTQFQGKTYYRVFNKDEFSQDPFIKFDAKLMWRDSSERFGIELFGVNLTDEDVLNSLFVGSIFTGGQVLGQYQPPRLFGVKLSVNYVADWIEELY